MNWVKLKFTQKQNLHVFIYKNTSTTQPLISTEAKTPTSTMTGYHLLIYSLYVWMCWQTFSSSFSFLLPFFVFLTTMQNLVTFIQVVVLQTFISLDKASNFLWISKECLEMTQKCLQIQISVHKYFSSFFFILTLFK